MLLATLGVAGCAPAAPEGPERAAALFATCASCHGQDGAGRKEYGAPAIAGLDAWYVRAQLEKFQNGARGAHPDDAAGLRMRPMSRTLRSAQDVAAVAEYVAALPEVAPAASVRGDASRGKSLYATCTACHGADARGSHDKHAPPLHRASDWYLVTQLGNFKAGIRGTHPADLTGAQMRPMALGLADEQAMRDVITYIGTLPD
jgi:cytochrome c553